MRKLYRVSINGGDWDEVEAVTAAHAASDASLIYIANSDERREIDVLIVQKAQRARPLADPRDGPGPRF